MQGQFFTPISLLKKTFRPGERSLSRQEVAHRLQSFIHVNEDILEQWIQTGLDAPSSPFREGNSRAIIEYHQENQPLSAHVYRFFQECGHPLTEEQILRKLRSYSLVSWSFPFERVGLQGDHRFSQLSDDRWLLSEWELANDAIYDYFTKQGTAVFTMREIPYLMQAKIQLPKKKMLFLPEVDERFSMDDQMVYIRMQDEHQPSQIDKEQEDSSVIPQLEGNINTSYLEVAAAMNYDTVEIEQTNQDKTVVDGVIEDLMGALIKLEKRSNDMKEEVISHFSSNNLDAIKGLMSEKEKNENVLQKIKEIVDELS